MAKITQADLDQFSGSTQYYRHSLRPSLKYTDGVHFLASKAGAYWLIDAIASYQIPKIRKIDIQFWRLTVNEEERSGLREMLLDIPGEVVVKQEIPFTDFPLPEIVLYLANDVLHLPGEY